MLNRKFVLGIGCCLIFATATAAQQQVDDKPPQWQRALKGEVVERAAAIEKRRTEAEEARNYEEATAASEQLFELRKEAQGEDHWETKDEKWILDKLRRVSKFDFRSFRLGC